MFTLFDPIAEARQKFDLPVDLVQTTCAMAPPRKTPRATEKQKRWSQRVTQNSDALDLDPGVFTWDDPLAIARSLKKSAEASRRRKATPFRSAMSMLNFYINRAGRQLPAEQRACLDAAKDELRALFGRPRHGQQNSRALRK